MENDFEPLRMLTIREAAELMQLSSRTLERLIRRNKFPGVKIGGQWRVRETELAKWINALDEL
jgi:excisionase family DNA binding protein